MKDIGMLFTFIGGLGMFLYGMHIMADGLQKSAGNKMKKLLGILTKNRFLGVIVGALVTAIIQSSSATTVLVVGFVNAGIIGLSQAVGVIMGANIGTTITAWIVSMSEWGNMLKPEFFAPLFIGIGAFILLFAKKQKKKDIGGILVGFGILFIGLSFMSQAIEPYKDAKIFSQAFEVLGSNPILGILVGAIVTGIIQSSSASVGILQTLAISGVVTWNSAIYITLGQNIGTCVTALLSSAGAGRTAKRAAIIHLLFNTIGAVIFGAGMFIVFILQPTLAAANISSVQISIFHTIFNVGNTLLLFPFAKQLVTLSGRIIRKKDGDKEEGEAQITSRHLDKRILESPSFAVEQAVSEVVHMGEVAMESMEKTFAGVLKKDEDALNQAHEVEKTINAMEKMLTEYLVKITNLSLTKEQHYRIKNLFYTISDIERIGDHIENIAEFGEQLLIHDLNFSEKAVVELKDMMELVSRGYESSLTARSENDLKLANKVAEYEDQVDKMEEDLRELHIHRLSERKCDPESGVLFLDIINNLERIADHAHNIAGYVMSEN